MSNILFNELNFKTKISIKISKITKNINNIILNKLKNTLENKCMENGFVEKDSIKILKRSNAYMSNLFDLSLIYFDIYYSCNVCNPVLNTIVSCKVIETIKPGLIATIYPLNIIIPIIIHKDKTPFNKININDTILVKIINTKIKLNDNQIQAVAILSSSNIDDNEDKSDDDNEDKSDDEEEDKSDDEEEDKSDDDNEDKSEEEDEESEEEDEESEEEEGDEESDDEDKSEEEEGDEESDDEDKSEEEDEESDDEEVESKEE